MIARYAALFLFAGATIRSLHDGGIKADNFPLICCQLLVALILAVVGAWK